MYCEEFDTDDQPGDRPGLERSGKRETPEVAPRLSAVKPLRRGLCVNCKHEATCTFARPEGGVWHCEEYE